MLLPLALALSLLTVILLASKRVNLGVSMLLGSAILGFLAMPPDRAARVMLEYAVRFKTINLAITIALISLLGSVLRSTGLMQELIEGLKKIGMGTKALLAVVPALMGVLPMPGGALLSAPIVDEERSRVGVSPVDGAYINLWFRHITFLVYPLTPAIIVLSEVSGVPVSQLLPYLIPAFLAMTLSGYMLSIRGIKSTKNPVKRDRDSVIQLLLALLPIAIVPVLGIVLDAPSSIPVAIGVALAILLGRPSRDMMVKAVKDAKLPKFALAMIGIMVFRGVVLASGVGELASSTLQGLPVPLPILIAVSAFFLGLATGYPTAAIIILISLLPNPTSLAMLSVLYTASVIGYVISPLHLCFVVTVEYCKVPMGSVYPKLIASTVATMLVSLLLPVFL